MTIGRTYGDACGVAHGLDLVGERWALLVVRELLLGPRRFTDLRSGLPGASPNVLSQRLRELETAGVVRRRTLPPPAASKVYELTEFGAELEPIVVGLGTWALRSGLMDGDGTLSDVSAMLTLRTFFHESDPGWRADFEVRFGEARYFARVGDGRVELVSEPLVPATVVDTDPRTFVDLVGGKRDLSEAAESGAVRVTGDRATVERLLASTRVLGAGVP